MSPTKTYVFCPKLQQLLAIAEWAVGQSGTLVAPSSYVYGNQTYFVHSEVSSNNLGRNCETARKVMRRNPSLLILPTHKNLRFDEIIDLFPFPEFLVGLAKNTHYVDTQEMNSEVLLVHDLQHIFQSTELSLPYLITSGVDARYQGNIINNLRFHERYGQLISNEPSKRIQTIIKATWFIIFHEPYVDLANNYNAAFVRKTLRDTKNFIQYFSRRIRDREDLGQAFKTPPTDTEIHSVVRVLIDFAKSK